MIDFTKPIRTPRTNKPLRVVGPLHPPGNWAVAVEYEGREQVLEANAESMWIENVPKQKTRFIRTLLFDSVSGNPKGYFERYFREEDDLQKELNRFTHWKLIARLGEVEIEEI